MLMKRTLGRSRVEVSALGLGCWAIGGPFLLDGMPDGWGAVDDAESIRAIQRAIDLGVTFFDTADVYGTGHSECILGEAIKGQRDNVIIATKFGYTYDEAQRATDRKYKATFSPPPLPPASASGRCALAALAALPARSGGRQQRLTARHSAVWTCR
jgi:aryl-alcohol dehydrogenase-like predicted oxidoreductase